MTLQSALRSTGLAKPIESKPFQLFIACGCGYRIDNTRLTTLQTIARAEQHAESTRHKLHGHLTLEVSRHE